MGGRSQLQAERLVSMNAPEVQDLAYAEHIRLQGEVLDINELT